MSIIQSITTAEQLLEAPDLRRCELVRGKFIMMSPAGFRRGRVVGTMSRILGNFVSQHGLGVVTGAETGFQIAHDPDTVRAPDVGYVRTDRIPEIEPTGFFQGPPDLAVEVLSPSDRTSEVTAKVQDWLQAGCQAVWVADPETRIISVYRADGDMVVLAADQTVEGGEVICGFCVEASHLLG